MNKNEEKRDQLIRETFDQCLSGIDEFPSARAEILSKAKQRPTKWEPIRFRVPAIAVTLVLALCVGILAGSGRLSFSGRPDQIKAGSQYTAQPIDTVPLSAGGLGSEQEVLASGTAPYATTPLYYDPNGETKYHIDQNCPSVPEKNRPMEDYFFLSELDEEPYRDLERCNVCGAPFRPSAYTASAADSANDSINEGVNDPASKPDFSLELDTTEFTGEGPVTLNFTVTNTQNEALPGVVTLYAPDNTQLDEFELPANATVEWSGEYTVTLEELEAGRLTCSVIYSLYDGAPDENGNPTLQKHKRNLSRKITLSKETFTTEIVENSHSVFDDLREYNPELLAEQKPLNLSAENDDLRLNILSGAGNENEILLLYTLEDLKGQWFRSGDNVPEFTPIFLLYDRQGNDLYGLTSHDVDTESHIATGYVEFYSDEPIRLQSSVVTVALEDPSLREKTSVDLLPILKEYGKTTEGVAAPASLGRGWQAEDAPALPEDLSTLKLLDYNNPLNIPLRENMVLTGIGWIDNRLHAQIHYTGSYPVVDRNDGTETWYAYFANMIGENWLSCSTLSWCDPGSDNYSWQEVIWDSTPNDVSNLLSVFIDFPVDVIEGTWAVEIPASAIPFSAIPTEQAPAAEPEEETRTLPEQNMADRVFEMNYPEIADEMRPLDLSSEQDGIRFSLTSGLVKENKGWFIFSMDDPEGKILNDYDSPCPELYLRKGDTWEDTSDFYMMTQDEEAHTAAFSGEIELDTSALSDDSNIDLAIKDMVVFRDKMVDLRDLLERYGKVTEGVDVSNDYSYVTRENAPRKVLDHSNPMNCILGNNVSLTNIGWIDNKLHIQLHYTGDTYHSTGSNPMYYCFSAWCSCYVNGEDCGDRSSDIEWDDNGDEIKDWLELVLPVAPEETIDELILSFAVPAQMLTDVWTFSVPFSSVRPDENAVTHEIHSVKFSMALEKTGFAPGEITQVDFAIANNTGYDIPGPVKLTSEDGTPIESLPGIIPAGETADMYFNWNVTEEQLKDGKISVNVEYSAYDGPAGEDGKPTLQAHKIRCARAITRTDGAAAERNPDIDSLPMEMPVWSITDVRYQNGYPQEPEELNPLNISGEDQGIRFTLLSGMIKGKRAMIFYSVEDPEGKLIKNNNVPASKIKTGSDYDEPYGTWVKDYNEMEHRAVCCAEFYFNGNPRDTNDTFSVLLYNNPRVDSTDTSEVRNAKYEFSVPYGLVLTEADAPAPGDSNITVAAGWDKKAYMPGETAKVLYAIHNNAGYTLPGTVKIIRENGTLINYTLNLDEGTIAYLEGSDLITKEMLDAGKVTFGVEYIAPDGPADEDGNPTQQLHRLWFTRRINWAGGQQTTNYVYLKPLQLSGNDYTNSDGIQVSLASGLANGNMVDFVYTITDPNGKIITPDNYKNGLPYAMLVTGSGPIYSSSISLADWDEAEHKATYWADFYPDDPILPREDGTLELQVSNGKISYISTYPADLLPLLKEYGKTVEKGMLLPENTGTVSTNPAGKPELSPKGKELLDNSNPLNIPLDEGLVLTNIGWLGNKLHIQIHSTEGIYNLNNGSSSFCRCVVSGVDLDDSVSISWNDDPDDRNRNDWMEYVLDCVPEEKDFIETLTLSVTPAHRDHDYVYTRHFTIPFESVKAD
ncbi:MAG: DUF4179 domain-containing protein [Clostridia bacterium]|nr:DUF4179 domain-containing protein [Clostridia bacterium]